MRIIFAGTPDFAAVALQALIDHGHEIVLTLTQPDRPSGRGMKLTPSPVKQIARKHNIPVLTPQTLSVKKDPENVPALHQYLKSLRADVLVVAAYGLILPQAVLDCAKGIGLHNDIRAINIHGSLLPRWRGAAPVARAIEQGDTETGITLMKMELGMDTGPMIMKDSIAITQKTTAVSLMQDLAKIGANLLVQALQQANTLTYEVQPEEGITYAEKLSKEEGLIHWTLTADRIDRKIRAFTPFPSTYFIYQNLPIKIWEATVSHGKGQPGEILSISEQGIRIACQRNSIIATVLQKPNKPRMNALAFTQSMQWKEGTNLNE